MPRKSSKEVPCDYDEIVVVETHQVTKPETRFSQHLTCPLRGEVEDPLRDPLISNNYCYRVINLNPSHYIYLPFLKVSELQLPAFSTSEVNLKQNYIKILVYKRFLKVR